MGQTATLTIQWHTVMVRPRRFGNCRFMTRRSLLLPVLVLRNGFWRLASPVGIVSNVQNIEMRANGEKESYCGLLNGCVERTERT